MRLFRYMCKDRAGQSRTAPKWYVELLDPQGRVRRVQAFTDKAASDELGRKLERLVALRIAGEAPDSGLSRWLEALPPRRLLRLSELGLLDARRLAATRPLSELLVEFESSLRSRDRTAKHVAHVRRHARDVLGGCGFRTWTDLQPQAVERFLRGQREGGRSVKTSNHALAALKQFCRWCVAAGYASEDPLRSLSPLNARVDPRRRRRGLTIEETRRLIQAAHDGPPLAGVAGPERGLLYLLAAQTGLRANELRSLRVASFDLADPLRASVTLQAAASKHRREDVLPLRADAAGVLEPFLRGRGALEPAFHLPRGWRPPRMLRADLERAGIPYRDESGRVFDFHALRGQCVTMLIAGGASPRVTQTLARHSSSELTVGLYARLRPDEERRALEVLPDLTPSTSEAARASGTDDRHVLASGLASEPAKPCRTMQPTAQLDPAGGRERATEGLGGGGGGGNRTRVPEGTGRRRLRA